MCASVMEADRGRFATVFRPTSHHFVTEGRRETQFQEWRKRHMDQLKKSAHIRTKLYEFCSKPRVLEQRHPNPSGTRNKLSPMSSRTDGRSSLPRRKRLTKTRPKNRSLPQLTKLVDTSSEEGDRAQSRDNPTLSSGTSLNPSDEGFISLETSSLSSRGGKNRKSGPRAKVRLGNEVRPEKLGAVIHELVMEVIEQSLSEVRLEERHMSHLVSWSRA